jgi:pimeloyl-ACP methyl ester carboxylesterase
MRGLTVVSVLAGVVTLAACSTSANVGVGAPPTSSGTSAPTTTGGAAGTSGAAVSPMNWGSCAPSQTYDVKGWECGSVQAPLDYNAPDGEQITIALTRFPAGDQSSRIGSLVVNPGGPGGSGIEIAHALLDELPSDVTARFDLVGFDPRGVGASTAVDCISDKANDAGADLDQTPDTPEEINSLVDQLQSTAATCGAEQGQLLAYLGTMSSARDLDRIRQAVGDDKLTYLGFSYGTSLGATYADLFPDKVRALVLDGVVDPSAGVAATGEPSKLHFYDTQDFSGAFDRFAKACSQVSTCSAGPDAKKLMEQVGAEVDKAPVAAKTVEAEDGRRLTTGLFETGVNAALYDVSSWPFLAVGLRDAADGDGSTLIRLADTYNRRLPDGTWENLSEAFRAILCADFADRPSVEQARTVYATVAGTGEDTPADGPNPTCVGWPKTAEPLSRVTKADTPPILVIGTRGDPATPYANTPAMAKALGNGVVLTWEGDGHTAFGNTSCIDGAVSRYLVDLEVPKDGTTCPATDTSSTGGTAPAGSEYTLDRTVLSKPIEEGLKLSGAPAKVAECVSKAVAADLDERQFVHFALGLDQPGLTARVSQAAGRC